MDSAFKTLEGSSLSQLVFAQLTVPQHAIKKDYLKLYQVFSHYVVIPCEQVQNKKDISRELVNFYGAFWEEINSIRVVQGSAIVRSVLHQKETNLKIYSCIVSLII